MKNYLSILCCLCLCLTTVCAQPADTPNKRPVPIKFYDKGNQIFSAIPLISAQLTRDGKDNIIPLGLQVEYGFFPLKNLLLSARLSGANIFYSQRPDANRQYLHINLQYYLRAEKRFSPYFFLMPHLLRWQYTARPGFIFYDDTPGKKYTHYLAFSYVGAGVSYKFARRFTLQAGFGYRQHLTNKTGRIPEGGIYEPNMGLFYHW